MKNIKILARKLKPIIPCEQYSFITCYIAHFKNDIIRFAAQLEKCPKLRKTSNGKEHPAIFHYISNILDIYICEFDGEDTMFGFTVLNGDIFNAEWSYISLKEIFKIPTLKLDYNFTEQTVEAALYRKYPNHFTKPASLE
jgi:hypothetical protein